MSSDHDIPALGNGGTMLPRNLDASASWQRATAAGGRQAIAVPGYPQVVVDPAPSVWGAASTLTMSESLRPDGRVRGPSPGGAGGRGGPVAGVMWGLVAMPSAPR